MGIIDKFFKGRRHSEVIANIVDNLNHLAQCELTVSEFYRLCGEAMVEEAGFWAELAEAEKLHAKYIKEMVRFIEDIPEQYSPGHAFNPAAIRTFKLQIEGLINSLNEGKIPLERLFDIATDIEKSAVELNFSEIVKTKNAEYNALTRRIAEECQTHRESLTRKAAK